VFTLIGEALLDMVQPEPDGAFHARPGGGPLNIAVGLRRLGHPTAMMARLSSGGLGGIVRRHAEDNNLDLTSSVATEDQTTLAFATLDREGRASYDFYVHSTADWGWTDAELSAIPPTTRVLHTGSVAAALQPGADAVLRLFQRLYADDEILLSYDPNVRPSLAGDRDGAVARAERFVAVSHVVKASDEDLAWLYPGQAWEDVLAHWLALGPEMVVMTRGPEGCVALRRGREPLVAAGRTVEVVDTIGAGDAFESGLLSGLADAGCADPGRVAKAGAEALQAAVERAVAVSAITCTRAGADPPTRTEYEAAYVGEAR